ncbi:MAG: hypothetical protein ABI321_19105 [Polyangia bacterium]
MPLLLPLLLAACGGAPPPGEGSGPDGATDGATSPNGTADAAPAPASDGGTVTAPGSANASGGSGGGDLSACPSCRVHVPQGYNPAVPIRLVVSLHGDEGRDFGLDSATGGVIGLWQTAADAAGYLLFAPACPAALGCDGAFSDWLAADGYDPSPAALGWLDGQVAELETRYNIDRSREYLTGYSGGAYWLGAYAPARASRYAAVAFIAGGMPAYNAFHGCAACKIPGYFLGGDGDYRTGGQMSDTANAFKGCGQEIHLELVTGADHEATIASLGTGNAAKILTWFDDRALSCP